MPDNVIDANRGVTIRFGPGGMEVNMYKDTPGVYLSNTGALLNEKVAAAAGFPVADLAKKREMQLRKSVAMTAIEEEFNEVKEEKQVGERGGYTVFHLGLGRHEVRDPDGVTLTERPMAKKEAMSLLSKLAPETPVEREDVAPPGPPPETPGIGTTSVSD